MATPTHDLWLDGRGHVIPLYERAFELVDSASGCVDAAKAEELSTEELSTEELSTGKLSTGKLAAEFAVELASPGQARRLALSALTEWGCGPDILQDAAVVVSELATNAVLHAASSFSLSVALEGSLLRITVHDARPLSATARSGGLSPRPTHGLGLVEALSLRWGAEGTAQGKAVWAELRASGELASDELQTSR